MKSQNNTYDKHLLAESSEFSSLVNSVSGLKLTKITTKPSHLFIIVLYNEPSTG